MQQHRHAPEDPAKRDNLYEPRADGEVCTDQDVFMRRHSLAVQAQKLPAMGWFGLAVAGSMLAGARRLTRKIR
jgi:hypothetical protein